VSISDGLSRRHEDHEDHDAILAAELQGNADSQRDRSVGVPFDAAAMRRAWPVVELQLDAFVTFEAS